eukprot:6399745-Pyramimonas_sp.AAC.1
MERWLDIGHTEHDIRHWWSLNSAARGGRGKIARSNKRGGAKTAAALERKGAEKEPALRIG